MPHLTFLDGRTAAVGASESIDAVNERFYAAGLTDGLPIIPPTRERVDAMLGKRDPAAVIATLAPLMMPATNEGVAYCAVMAGCRPEHMPVLIAAVQAIAEPQFNLLGVQTTTGSAAVSMILNGPIVKRLGVNFDVNALGPGVRANAATGRGLALVLRNVAGAIPNELDMATMGQPGKYTFCYAENESANTWEPLHASRGFEPGESCVTVFAAAGTMEVRDECSNRAETLLTTFGRSMIAAGSAGAQGFLSSQALVLLAPDHARIVGRDASRKEAQAILYEAASLPLSALSPEMQSHLRKNAGEIDKLRITRSPDDILIAVVGGAGNKSTYVPSWGGGTFAVTKCIPDS